MLEARDKMLLAGKNAQMFILSAQPGIQLRILLVPLLQGLANYVNHSHKVFRTILK